MDDIALLLTEANDSNASPDPAATTPAPELAPSTTHADRGDLDDAELTAWLDLAGQPTRRQYTSTATPPREGPCGFARRL